MVKVMNPPQNVSNINHFKMVEGIDEKLFSEDTTIQNSIQIPESV
jgi:hypothetical protein